MKDLKKREMTDLEKNIYKDIQLEIHKFYEREEIEFKNNETPEDTIIDFFSYLFRLIPSLKRTVYYSKELSQKIQSNELSKEHIEILNKFRESFENGIDMNGFLSNNIKNSRKTDFLRYTWQLFHLHMSNKVVENKKQMKNNRSDTQLLCIINQNDVYFIDVIPHPNKPEKYFDIRSLEIIINNGWIEKIGFYEIDNMIPGTLQPKIKDDKDIFELYSNDNSFNLAFEFNGKGYASLLPMNIVKRPYEATNELIRINRELYALNKINGKYIGFEMGCNKDGILMGIVSFEMSEGNIKRHNIF